MLTTKFILNDAELFRTTLGLLDIPMVIEHDGIQYAPTEIKMVATLGDVHYRVALTRADSIPTTTAEPRSA